MAGSAERTISWCSLSGSETVGMALVAKIAFVETQERLWKVSVGGGELGWQERPGLGEETRNGDEKRSLKNGSEPLQTWISIGEWCKSVYHSCRRRIRNKRNVSTGFTLYFFMFFLAFAFAFLSEKSHFIYTRFGSCFSFT